jgi:hypothetical protein
MIASLREMKTEKCSRSGGWSLAAGMKQIGHGFSRIKRNPDEAGFRRENPWPGFVRRYSL